MVNNEKNKITEHEVHHAARPMKVILDTKGYAWLCDENVNPTRDLKEQGCWACGGEQMAFTRDD